MSSAWDHPIEKHYKVDASLCHAAEIDGASTSPRGDPVELFGRPSYLPPIYGRLPRFFRKPLPFSINPVDYGYRDRRLRCTGIIPRATLIKRAGRSGLVYGVRPLHKG